MRKLVTDLLLEVRCRSQANELAKQRERIFELKALIKKLERKVSEKQRIIDTFKESRRTILKRMWEEGGKGLLLEVMEIIDEDQYCLSEKMKRKK
jgi:hypothetical protein